MTLRTAILGLSLAAALMVPYQPTLKAAPNAATTPLQHPRSTQRAYRRAIILLTVTAGGIFLATVTALKRHR